MERLVKQMQQNINICLILLVGTKGTILYCAGISMHLNYSKIKYKSGKLKVQDTPPTHRFM